MKTVFFTFLVFASMSASAAQSQNPTSVRAALTQEDRENLKFALELHEDYLGKKQYELGGNPIDVTDPSDILSSHEGIYFTGRILTRRWGKNKGQSIESYSWNMNAGERWWCAREMILWSDDQGGWRRSFQGPLIGSDYPGQASSTILFEGEAPDWSLFPGIN